MTLGGNSTINASGANLTMSRAISGTGYGITKSGSYTLTLSGTSGYTGGTTVSAGTLKLTGSLASSAVTVSGGTLESGGSAKSIKSLSMSSGTLKVSTANTFSGTGAASLTGGTVNFDASGWTKTGITKSWTIYAGGAAATCSGVTLSVTAATGTVGASVNAGGDSTTVSFGYSTTSGSYGTAGTVTGSPVTGTSATAVSTSLSSLTPGATYYYRWSAYNSVNGSGSPVTATGNFTTLAAVPGAPTLTAASSTSITVALATGSNVNTVQYAIKVVTGSTTKYVQADGTLGASAVWQTAATWGTPKTVTGLSAATTYTVSVAAKNSAGTATAYGTTANVTTASGVVKPTVTEGTKTIGTTSATLPITVNMGGGATTANITLKYSTTSGSYTTDATVSPLTLAANVTAGAVSGSMSSLSAGTVYYYQWTVANSAGSTTKAGSFATEPTAGTVTLTGATATSLVVTGKRSNGNAMLIVMKKGSDPSWTPTDGTKYDSVTGDKALTAGTSVATGEYIVYNSTGGTAADGTSVTISGLDSGSIYYAKVYTYAYVASGTASGYNYNTTSPGSASAYTLSTEPTWASPSLTATAAGTSQINLSWGAATGASGYVVVRKDGSSASTTKPSDGTSYSTGSGLGGTIVYVGSSTSYNNTGLSAGTTYSYTVWAYNGVSGTAATYNYLTTGSATATAKTTAAEPTTQASGLGSSTYSTSGAKLTWTKGNGTYTLVAGTAADSLTAAPTDRTAYTASTTFSSGGQIATGVRTVYTNNSTTVTISGLTANTLYTFGAYSFNGTSDGTTTTYNYKTDSFPTTQFWTTANAPSAAPAIAVASKTDTTMTFTVTKATGASGTLVIMYTAESMTGPSNPRTTYSPSTVYKSGTRINNQGYVVYMGTDATKSLQVTGLDAATTYYVRAYSFNGTSSSTAALCSVAYYTDSYGSANGSTWASEPTGAPTLNSIGSTARTTNSITVSFTKGANAANTIVLARYNSNTLDAPVDGATYTANATYGSGTQVGNSYVVYAGSGTGSVTVTGLTPGAPYYFVAYSYNGDASDGTANFFATASTVRGARALPMTPTLTAAADGKTMVRLGATKGTGTTSGMILVYGGSGAVGQTVSAIPAVGDSLGDGTVIWTGTGNNSAIEHVVAAGGSHKYRLFSYSNKTLSTETNLTVSTAAITGGQVETFSYTNGSAISSTDWAQPDNGWSSTGWAAWDSSDSYIKIAQPAINGKGLLNSNRLNQAGGNAMDFNASNATRVVRAYRAFDSAYTSGKVWFMFSVRTEFGGDEDGKTFGAQFMSTAGDSSTIFASVGKPPDRYTSYPGLAVDTSKNGSGLPAGSSITWGGHNDSYVPNYSLADYGHGSPAGNNEATNYHTIYGYIDLSASNNKMYVNAAYSGTVFTNSSWEREPTTWDVNGASISASSVAGMTLYSVGYCGRVQFDEVRVASSWEELLGGSLQTPDDFTAFAADRDGNEMVRWTFTAPANSKEIVIIDKTNRVASALTATEMALKSAAVGTEAGKAIVAYRGPAVAGSSYEVDHVVKPGTSHAYYAYAVNVTEYSENCKAATGNPVTTDPYESWEKLDTFSYTNGVQVSASGNAWKGGQGWGDNYWGSSGSGNWYSLKPEQVPSYMVNHVTNYPDSAGNVICITNLNDGQNATFNRVVESFGGSAGTTIYFAYRMAYAHSGDNNNRWAGLQFVSGGRTIFVGKAAATDHRYHLGINATGASSPCWPNVGSGGTAYELKGLSDATVGRNAYLVVGKIEWIGASLVNVYANAFYTGGGNAMLPENEPSWGSYGYSGATFGAVDNIQFIAGADPGHGSIGYAYFDELRWGTSWEQLLAGKAPTDVWMAGQTKHVYTGDIVTNALTSEPKGAKQSAQSLLWTAAAPNDATWTANAIAAAFYTNKASDTQTEWHGVHQITNTSSTILYGLGAVTGNGTTVKSQNHGEAAYKTNTFRIAALKAPTLRIAAGDFKENLSWTRAKGTNETGTANARTFNEVMVMRFLNAASKNAAAGTIVPNPGQTYHPGDTIVCTTNSDLYATVVYRGNDATNCVDSGLAKSNTYYYVAYTVNNSYYSPRSSVVSAQTTGTTTTPTVNGDATDWVGGASTTPNSAAYAEEEFIWTDKKLDGRQNTDECKSADIKEFRVKATASTVYFLLRLAGSTPASVNPTNAYVVVGVDTRRSSGSTAMNWLGDEAATFVVGGYYQTNAAIHYPRRQMAVHYVGGSEKTWQVEMYADDGAEWYGPSSRQAACSAGGSADPCIEWCVAREDLGLTGICTGRFTVATFVNSQTWNNQGAGTVRFDSGSCAAVDAMEIVPYGVNDQDGNLGAWDEGLKDGNVNFWADVRFKADGLNTHGAPGTPDAVTGASGGGSPKLQWTKPANPTGGFITGYLLEVSTNASFGTGGDKLLYRVNIEGADTTSYQTRTSVSNFYWRVRARSNSGILSAGPDRFYTVDGKKDVDGPLAKLLYVGTNVMGFINNTVDPETGIGYRDDQEASGDATSVKDSDLQDHGQHFGFVIEWYDVNGVYATNRNRNTGEFAWNILAEHADGNPYGRVSPNWDLIILDRKATSKPADETVDGVSKEYTQGTLTLPTENGGTETLINCWYIDCGKDAVFSNAETINDGNSGLYVTNYVTNAFRFGGYRDGVELYLTVSAEDSNTQGASGPGTWFSGPLPNKSGSDPEGSWGPDARPAGVNCSGYCADGPNSERNVTTNQLLKFYVRDNDATPPVASTNVWGAAATNAAGAKFTPSLVISTGAVTKAQTTEWGNIPGKLAPISGAGRDVTYQLTDQVIGATNLTFLFNVYDDYLHSGLRVGTSATSTGASGRMLTNTAFKVLTWDGAGTNWLAGGENTAKYASSLSTLAANGTGAGTVLAWTFADSTHPVTEASLESLFGVENILSTIGTNSAGATNLVQLHAWDRDDNRTGDQADAELTFGKLMLTDDDATAPASPGYDLLGTGTNHVEFGTLASWDWTGTNQPASWSTDASMTGIEAGAMQAYNVVSSDDVATNALWTEKGSAPAGQDWSGFRSHYMSFSGGMTGSGYRTSGKSKYFQFDVSGKNGTRWTADTLQFDNRVSAKGPAQYTLTVQEATNVTILAAVTDGQMTSGWEITGGLFEKKQGIPRFTMENAALPNTALLTSPKFLPKGKVMARVQFRVGRIGEIKDDAELTVSYQIGEGTPEELHTYASSNFTGSAAASYANYSVETFDLPTNEEGEFRVLWSASGLNGAQGFLLTDVRVILQNSFATEVPLVSGFVVEKNVSDTTDAATETVKNVVLTWAGRENADGATWRYRLYAYGAGSSSGTWGINRVKLHGITMSPRGVDVTDGDLRHATWVNSLEVVDGEMSGWDTEKSGLWLTGEKAPTYTLSYPEADTEDSRGGTVFASGSFAYKDGQIREAAYASLADGKFEESPTAWTLVDATIAAGSGAYLHVLKLAATAEESSAVRSSATKSFNASLPAGAVSGVTVSGGFDAKASVAEGSGGVNGLTVTIRLKDQYGALLLEKAFAYTPVAAWRHLEIGPWSVDSTLVRSAEVEIAQETADGTEIQVGNVAVQLATWGELTSTIENGVPGAKLELQTTELPKQGLKLSSELAGEGSREYVLTSTVHDYDRDRTDDALPLTVERGFELFDNDTQVPLLGAKFGGPFGIRLGNRAASPYNSSGTSVEAVVTDQQMESAKREGQTLAFLDIDGYDQSAWTTTALTLDYTEGGTAKSLAYAAGGALSAVVTNGAAGEPSATNTFSCALTNLWSNTFVKSQFAAYTADMTVNATLQDLDDDRSGDSMVVTNRLGYLKFLDNDKTAPALRTTGTLKGMFIATNPPDGSIEIALAGVSNKSWAAETKATYEVRTITASSTASSRVQRIYDGELRRVSPFYLMANVGDVTASGTGVTISGLQRGAATTKSVTNAFNDTVIVSNTTMVLSNATAGIVTNLATHFNEGYSSAFKTTRGGTAVAPQTWYWPTGMTREEVGALLPSDRASLDYRVIVEAFDCDTNRPGDQMHARLQGPKRWVTDDDTVRPNNPTEVKVNGKDVTGTVTAANAAWTNNLENWNVSFVGATDGAVAGDDITESDVDQVNGYRMVTKVAGLATNDGGWWLSLTNAVALTTTDAGSGRRSAGLTAEQRAQVVQGLTTQLVFAVDKDDDRPGDSLASSGVEVPLAYDCTRPTKIGYHASHRLSADSEHTDDPTTQFDLTWPTTHDGTNPVGPDDPLDTDHHPTKKAADTALFSPWATYKIYYGTYKETEVPETGTDLYFYNKFIATNAYKTFDYVTAESTAKDPSATNALPYGSLTNVTADAGAGLQKIRLYDLDFDQHYIVVIVGVDKAGNEGLAGQYSWATNNTIKFAITQGVIRASSAINAAVGVASGTNSVGMAPIPSGGATKAAALYWMAAGMKDGVGKVSKYYDLIYRDAPSFDETGAEQWNMATSAGNSGTSKTNWNYQADAGLDTPNRLRFYRASYAGRWQGTSPLASEEVYSMNNVVLSEGWNYVSLQGVPYTNTFRGVFGTDTDMWPQGGRSPTDTNGAVIVQFYTPGTGEKKGDWYFFADGEWCDSAGKAVTDDPQAPGFFARPFSLTLPESNETTDASWWNAHGDYEGAKASESKSVKAMLWHPIMQVPTNAPQASAQTIQKAAGTYNLLSLNLPVAVHPGALGLEAAGMCTNANPWAADKLYVIDSRTKEVRNNSMMYPDGTGKWRWVKDRSEISGAVIFPNDMLVILSSGNATNNWNWTYHPTNFYTLPTRHMGR